MRPSIINGNEIKFRLRQAKSMLRDLSPSPGKSDIWNRVLPIFVVSTGRTGTHFLSHFFDTNFQRVIGFHEPDPDLFFLNVHYAKGNISARRAESMFKDYREQAFRRLTSKGINAYVESNHSVSFLIPVIRRIFDQYKIIHIQRDGREFVRSAYSKTTYGRWVGTVNILAENDPRERLNATFFPDDPYHDIWHQLSRFQKLAWYWANKDRLIWEQTRNDENALVLKFEDLFVKKDLKTWNKMIDFTGLRPSLVNEDFLAYVNSSKSNQTRKDTLPKWPEWASHQQKQFEAIAGEHMQNIGYNL